MKIIKILVIISSFIDFNYSSNLKIQEKQIYQQKLTSLYWFDANTNEFITYGESTFCDHSTNTPCSLGYITVNNPSIPIKPNRSPDSIEYGSSP